MRRVTLTRIVNAPRERVWQAWTDADEMARWFWPQRLAPACRMNPREGGSWRIISDALGIEASGEFTGIEPLKRLDYTWRWNDEDDETHVTVTLEDAVATDDAESRPSDAARPADAPRTDAPATSITVVHTGFPTAESAEEHEVGWSDCLDRLPAALAS
jgi:uncharacterized protein YndB with AHSA1/START domain